MVFASLKKIAQKPWYIAIVLFQIFLVHFVQKLFGPVAIQMLDASLGNQLQIVGRVNFAIIAINGLVFVRPPTPYSTSISVHLSACKIKT